MRGTTGGTKGPIEFSQHPDECNLRHLLVKKFVKFGHVQKEAGDCVKEKGRNKLLIDVGNL